MGGGLMQLVAYGAQDVYLTGNPQITFFKVVYRRHTNFSMESIKQTSSGGDSDKSWTISRSGDLIRSVFLEKYEDAIPSFNTAANAKSMILDTKKIRYNVEIGGQVIQKFDNLWRLTNNCLRTINPTFDENTLLNRMCNSGIQNLPFWFSDNPGLALPLIALQYHEVKINVEASGGLGNVELWVDYIYLDTDERRRFAQVSHEYLIEQVQQREYSIQGNSVSCALTFNHPVKELVWVLMNGTKPTIHNVDSFDSQGTCKLILNGQDRFSERKPCYFSDLQVNQYHSGCGSLSLGDLEIDLIQSHQNLEAADGDTTDSTGIGKAELLGYPNSSVQWGDDGPGSVTGMCNFPHQPVYVYSFALKPEEHQPSGTCNFSRIDNAALVLTGISNDDDSEFYDIANKVMIYAVNYNVLRIMSGMGGLAYSN